MGKLFSLKGLKILTITIGILGNDIWKVKADDCALFQTAMQLVDETKYNNMGDCCSTNMVTCENNSITKM